jgi:outer membrane biosynthesis protein TonB
MMLTSAAPAHAQGIPAEDATSTTDIVAPNPFPLATTTPTPAVEEQNSISTTSLTTVKEETPAATPPAKQNKKPVPAPAVKKNAENPAASTASTAAFIPPTPATLISGNIYTYARHAPLSKETTGGLLAVAVLSTILGALMVHKRYLDRLAAGVSAYFSPSRSLPQPQAER